MSTLLRATELHGLVVVTLGGDEIADVKDVVWRAAGGSVLGFTLNKRGLFGGPMKEVLTWAALHWVGPDAVMVPDATVLVHRDDVTGAGGAAGRGGGDVIGDDVLTEDGRRLGRVVDVIIEVEASGDVVGYEIEADEGLRSGGQRVLLPLPDTLAVSGEKLIVPAAAVDFVADDLAGFGAAVEQFRTQLRTGTS